MLLCFAAALALAWRVRAGKRFRRLYDAGCVDAYDGDHSRADLAFWTKRDPARIDQLFRRSALMRAKWDERHVADRATYGEMEIRKVPGEV